MRLVVAAVGLLLGVIWALRNRNSGIVGPLEPALAWLGVAGLVVVTVASLTMSNPWLGLLGRYPRYEGLPMLTLYLALVMLGAWLAGPGADKRRGHMLSALAVLQVVLMLWALVQSLVDPQNRVTTPVGNASDVGVIGVVGFGMLIWYALQQSHWLFWTGAASAAILVGLTASRGAWLGLGAIVIVGALLLIRQGRLRASWRASLVLVAAVVVVVVTPLARSRGLGTSALAGQTVTGRVLLWQETLSLWWHNALLGVGPSGFVDAIGRFHTEQWASQVGPDNPPDAPHNVILQVMASTGLVGLAVAVAFAVVLARVLWRSRHDEWTGGAFLAMGGALVCYQFHFTDLWNIVPLLLIAGGALGAVGDGPPVVQRSGGRGKAVTPAPAGRTGAGWHWFTCVAGVAALLLGIQTVVTETMFANALTNLQTGSPQGMKQITTALHIKPQDPDLAWRAGHALTVLTQSSLASPSDAVTVLTAACGRLPGSVECLNDLALANLRAGDAATASTLLQQSLAIDRVNVTTLLYMASARDALGDQTGAEQTLLQAASLRPVDPDPWTNLAILYKTMGRDADAHAAQTKADQLSGH